MTDIDLGKPANNTLEFYIRRAEAIEAYAGLEQSLSMLVSHLLGVDVAVAAVIFYQIVNTKSRNRIIEELLQKRHSTAFDAYWFGIPKTPDKKGLMTIINGLDGRRNQIIHWHTVRNISDTEDECVLMPPTFWSDPEPSPQAVLKVSDLAEFIAIASFASRSLNMFLAYQRTDLPRVDGWRETWSEIFQQPCVYPPSSSHPLSPKT